MKQVKSARKKEYNLEVLGCILIKCQNRWFYVYIVTDQCMDKICKFMST